MMTQITKSVTRVVLLNPHTLAQSNKEETKAPFMIHRMSLVFKSMTIVFTVIFCRNSKSKSTVRPKSEVGQSGLKILVAVWYAWKVETRC